MDFSALFPFQRALNPGHVIHLDIKRNNLIGTIKPGNFLKTFQRRNQHKITFVPVNLSIFRCEIIPRSMDGLITPRFHNPVLFFHPAHFIFGDKIIRSAIRFALSYRSGRIGNYCMNLRVMRQQFPVKRIFSRCTFSP